MAYIDAVTFNEQGLVPVIAQDKDDGTVLMMAWADKKAIEETVRTGFATYFSRSRNKLWRKGEESGNVQKVSEIAVDCDGDTVLYKVEQVGGAACHTGHRSCFFKTLKDGLWVENAAAVFDPDKKYGKHL